MLVLMKKPKGAQKRFLNEILGFIRTTSKEQTETIECIKAWKGRFFEQPTLLLIHEETLGIRKMSSFPTPAKAIVSTIFLNRAASGFIPIKRKPSKKGH